MHVWQCSGTDAQYEIGPGCEMRSLSTGVNVSGKSEPPLSHSTLPEVKQALCQV